MKIYPYPVDISGNGWWIDGTQLIDIEVGGVWIRPHAAVTRDDGLSSEGIQPPDTAHEVVSVGDRVHSTAMELFLKIKKNAYVHQLNGTYSKFNEINWCCL